MDSAIDLKVRFYIIRFCKYNVFTVFLERHVPLVLFFHLVNLIVAYPLNESKPQL